MRNAVWHVTQFNLGDIYIYIFLFSEERTAFTDSDVTDSGL